MSVEKAGLASRQIRGTLPNAHAVLVLYIEELKTDAETNLRCAIENTLLRQNQGKAQLCEEILRTLNI